MSGWAAKRFWSAAIAEPCAGGHTVRLDARAVKTPAKAPLVVPTLAMAQAIAAEWDAQQGRVRPETMPVTRAANSAIDKITPQFDAVAGMLADYGGSDLLCYRATEPAELIARQAAAWDPLLDWAASTLKAPLRATSGVMHIAQPPESLKNLSDRLYAFSPFQLAGVHDLVAISGSLVLALAVTEGHLAPAEAWTVSRIDEAWQIEQWGDDEDAAVITAARHEGFLQAGRFFRLCG